MTPSINCVIGDFGTGKTLFLVSLAKANLGIRNIYANFKLYGIEYTPISIDDLAGFPDWIHDGIVLLDEGHVGVGIYDIFKKEVRDFSVFISQIRKRNVFIFWTSQFFSRVAKPLRMYTKNMYEFSEIYDGFGRQIKGTANVKVFDLHNKNKFINVFNFDGRSLFNFYDTNEIVTGKTDNNKKGIKIILQKPLTL